MKPVFLFVHVMFSIKPIHTFAEPPHFYLTVNVALRHQTSGFLCEFQWNFCVKDEFLSSKSRQ